MAQDTERRIARNHGAAAVICEGSRGTRLVIEDSGWRMSIYLTPSIAHKIADALEDWANTGEIPDERRPA